MVADRIEQRNRLRNEAPPADRTTVVRGGRDTSDKLRRHALRTARAWSLDGLPLWGVSVFTADVWPLDQLLRERFATFRVVHLPTVGDLRGAGYELLPTGLAPHFTLRLRRGDDAELRRLLDALGEPRDNPEYGQRAIWREEGWDVPGGHQRRPQR
jgi:hypothetical protein